MTLTKVNREDIRRLVIEWSNTALGDENALENWLKNEEIESEAFRAVIFDMIVAHGTRMEAKYGNMAITRPMDIYCVAEMAVRFGYEMHKQFKGEA